MNVDHTRTCLLAACRLLLLAMTQVTTAPSQQRIDALERALTSRDRQIDILEDEIASWQTKVDALRASNQEALTDLSQAEKMLAFEKSMTAFQEKQIAEFREVVRNQRDQIDQLNAALAGEEP